jgi:hypothetical protein
MNNGFINQPLVFRGNLLSEIGRRGRLTVQADAPLYPPKVERRGYPAIPFVEGLQAEMADKQISE